MKYVKEKKTRQFNWLLFIVVIFIHKKEKKNEMTKMTFIKSNSGAEHKLYIKVRVIIISRMRIVQLMYRFVLCGK